MSLIFCFKIQHSYTLKLHDIINSYIRLNFQLICLKKIKGAQESENFYLGKKNL